MKTFCKAESKQKVNRSERVEKSDKAMDRALWVRSHPITETLSMLICSLPYQNYTKAK